MAFPSGYATYQEVTIDHTKVASDQTDFVVYINLADLVKAGADIFDSCRSDGGDIRATKTDGTTELPVEVVAIDTTGKTGEIHVKFSGTLSSSTDTVIRIWYNGTDVLPAVTDTYGRNNVWTDSKGIYHLADTTDSTGNGYTLTNNGSTPFNNAKLGKGADYNGSTQSLNNNSILGALSYPRSFSLIANFDTIASDRTPLALGDGAVHYYSLKITSASLLVFRSNNNTQAGDVSTGVTVSAGTNYFVTIVQHSTTSVSIHVNGTKTNTTATTYIATVSQLFSGYLGRSSAWYMDGRVDELRVRNSAISDSLAVTNYNNQNSPSTFYSTGNEVGSGTDYPMTASVGTFTLNGIATSVTSQRTVVGGISSFTLTGIDVAFAIGKGINCSTGEFVLTGNSTGLSSQRTMPVSVGSFVLTGIDANFEFTQRIVAETGVFIFTGMDAVLRPSNIWSNTEKNNVDWVNSSKS